MLMFLKPHELQQFFRLSRALLLFVNQQLQVLADQPATPDAFSHLPVPKLVQVRDALVGRLDLIRTFVEANPAHLPEEELAIIRSWEQLVAGKFFIFRELKNFMVFLTDKKAVVAYGVLALSQRFEEIVGPSLPVLVETVLLPFKDRIVYDSFLCRYRISFGAGIRESLNESYREAKARHGIVTSLPMTERALVPAANPSRASSHTRPQQKEKVAEVLQAILDLIEPMCRAHLNEEYSVLCRKLAETLARKRPSPLLHGHASTWASGIVRTIGWVNFLGDPSQKPHLKMTDIDEAFGCSPAGGASKLKAIRDLLRIGRLDPQWTLPSRLERNPLVWMLSVNGFVMDIRLAPREAQVVAFEKGLIPYIPADRAPGGSHEEKVH
jgi:hypothetical protein